MRGRRKRRNTGSNDEKCGLFYFLLTMLIFFLVFFSFFFPFFIVFFATRALLSCVSRVFHFSSFLIFIQWQF